MKEKLKLINLEESLPQIEKLTKQFNELNNQINKYVKKKNYNNCYDNFTSNYIISDISY